MGPKHEYTFAIINLITALRFKKHFYSILYVKSEDSRGILEFGMFSSSRLIRYLIEDIS